MKREDEKNVLVLLTVMSSRFLCNKNNDIDLTQLRFNDLKVNYRVILMVESNKNFQTKDCQCYLIYFVGVGNENV